MAKNQQGLDFLTLMRCPDQEGFLSLRLVRMKLWLHSQTVYDMLCCNPYSLSQGYSRLCMICYDALPTLLVKVVHDMLYSTDNKVKCMIYNFELGNSRYEETFSDRIF